MREKSVPKNTDTLYSCLHKKIYAIRAAFQHWKSLNVDVIMVGGDVRNNMVD